jgi:hypothetical protein
MVNGWHQDYGFSSDPVMGNVFSPERWQGLIYQTMQTPVGAQDTKFAAMWRVWTEHHSISGEIRSVTFHEETVALDLGRDLESQRQLR